MTSINPMDFWLSHVYGKAEDLSLIEVEIDTNEQGIFWEFPSNDKCDHEIFVDLFESNGVHRFAEDLDSFKYPERLLIIDRVSSTILVNSLKFYEAMSSLESQAPPKWKIRWIDRQDEIVPEAVKIVKNHLPRLSLKPT